MDSNFQFLNLGQAFLHRSGAGRFNGCRAYGRIFGVRATDQLDAFLAGRLPMCKRLRRRQGAASRLRHEKAGFFSVSQTKV